MTDGRQVVELTSEFFRIGSSSFTDFASRVAPDVLPSSRTATGGLADLSPHGTTIVAATFPGGVVMAGDRRATMGICRRSICHAVTVTFKVSYH